MICDILMNILIYYRFHPNIGAIVQIMAQTQRPIMRIIAPVIVKGFPAKPFTITLYLSKAIIHIVQMEPHPNREPSKAYISHKNGPNTHVS